MNSEPLSVELFQNVFSSIDKRKELLNNGIHMANIYFEKVSTNTTSLNRDKP